MENTNERIEKVETEKKDSMLKAVLEVGAIVAGCLVIAAVWTNYKYR